MSVEWLRACYAGTWHLFKDAPAITTRGRYYFSPPDTPFFDGLHHLGSRRWHDANWQTVVALGEDIESSQTWDRGYTPAALPQNRIVGERACIAQGEAGGDAIDVDELIDGFPPQCFVAVPRAELDFSIAATIDRCTLQRFYARIISLLYDDADAAIADAFHELLGDQVTVTVHRATDLLNAVVTVVCPDYAIIVVDGTRNFQQLAMQGMQSLHGPIDYGSFGTNPLWYLAATRVNAFAGFDGVDPTKPILLVGHSYGGAVCNVLAGRYRQNSPERRIRVLTYGCPKPGDIRLRSLLLTCDCLNLANDADVITAVPPDAESMGPVLGLFPMLIGREISAWERPPNQTIQGPEGQLTPGPPTFLDYSTLVAMITDCVEDRAFRVITAHRITAYIERIETRCAKKEWPLTTAVIDTWLDVPTSGYTIVGGDTVRPGHGVALGGFRIGGECVKPARVLSGGFGLSGNLVGSDTSTILGGIGLGGELVSETETHEGAIGMGGEAIGPSVIEGGLGMGGDGP